MLVARVKGVFFFLSAHEQILKPWLGNVHAQSPKVYLSHMVDVGEGNVCPIRGYICCVIG